MLLLLSHFDSLNELLKVHYFLLVSMNLDYLTESVSFRSCIGPSSKLVLLVLFRFDLALFACSSCSFFSKGLLSYEPNCWLTDSSIRPYRKRLC